MITEIKTVYKCEHCKKLYQIKQAAMRHEERCSKNPQNFRACLKDCKYITQKEAEVLNYDYTGGEHYSKYQFFFCEKKNIFVYPPKIEWKGRIPDTEEVNEPMPKIGECAFYEKPRDLMNYECQQLF